MTRRWLLTALPLLIVGCQREESPGQPTTFSEDGLSLIAPPGWQVKHQKDTLVFVGDSPDEDARPVIAVRAVSLTSWSEPRTAENVIPSVRAVLEALPGAEVTGPTEIGHPAYRAVAFDVVFTPRSKRGKKYRRRHVVLEANQHLYHAFLTAPEGQLARNLPAFERVLASLREEA